MKKHINIKVTGRVQGVSFRVFTRNLARQLGVNGLVRNEHDNSVYIEVEGEEEILQKFINEIKEGPPHADVTDLKISDGELQSFGDFRIEHRF